MSDFVEWEPGRTVVCALCGCERGGGNPPGAWIRHRPSHRRRIPIFHQVFAGLLLGRALGYLEYIDP